jgi:hypothetical protein
VNSRQGRSLLAAAVALAVLAGIAVPAVGANDLAGAVEGIAARSVDEAPAEIRAYWTPARMRAAAPAAVEPAEGAVPAAALADPGTPTYVQPSAPGEATSPRLRGGDVAMRATDVSSESAGFPRRVHGKVFLTLGGEDYACSGTVVNSFSHTVVWTAAHCVNGADIGLGFAENWMFVPGYRDGQRPYGTWTASKLLAPSQWRDAANVRYDIGAALLARDGEGRGIEDVVGSQGIAFNQSRNQNFEALGYPAGDMLPLLPPNFDGERLWSCRSPRTANDNPSGGAGPQTMEIECDMTAGSSGGSWVIRDAFVNSVTSYGYQLDANHLYGPYQGSVAEDLYRAASGPKLRCAGRAATNVGGPGSDDFDGGGGRDGFLLRGGDDRAAGAAKADAACGGGGGDRLSGAGGADVLRGGAGADTLVGGPGRDVCDGGPGRDRALGCERKRRIP